jgi:hypothetical protein
MKICECGRLINQTESPAGAGGNGGDDDFLNGIPRSAWPPADVVRKLVECADILFDQKNYDGDQWEQLHAARAIARDWLRSPAPKRGRPKPPLT